jgi:hypothetical protein
MLNGIWPGIGLKAGMIRKFNTAGILGLEKGMPFNRHPSLFVSLTNENQ